MRVRYKPDQPLDAAVEAVLSKALRSRFETETLRVVLEAEAPPEPPAKTGRRAARPKPR